MATNALMNYAGGSPNFDMTGGQSQSQFTGRVPPEILAQLLAAYKANPTLRQQIGESDAGALFGIDPRASVGKYQITLDPNTGQPLIYEDVKRETWGQDVANVYGLDGLQTGVSSGDSTALGLAKFIAASAAAYGGANALGGETAAAGASAAPSTVAPVGATGVEFGAITPEMLAGSGTAIQGGGMVGGAAGAAGAAPSLVSVGAADLAPIAFEPITAQTLVGSGAWQPVAGAAAGAAAGSQVGQGAGTKAAGTAAGTAASGAGSGGQMSWADWAEVGANLGSTLINSEASKDAAQAQTDAANQATQLQRDMYNDAVARNKPWEQGGRAGFDELLMQLGLAGDPNDPRYGSLTKIPTAADVMADPGYQFGLQQGQNALNAQFNARGMRNSGAQVKAAARYGTDYGTTKYGETYARMQGTNQDIYNRLMGVSQVGQAAANNTTTQGNIFASNAGNNLIAAGNANAANSLAQGSMWGNALNQGVSIYNRNSRQQNQGIWDPQYDDTGGQWGGWTGQR